MIGPVNPNIVAYPLTSRERRTVGLLRRITTLDDDQTIEFTRLFAWEIRTSPGGADGLARKRFPHLEKK